VSVIKAHYESLAPRLEYLSDPVVLSQAWKKSHNYIRRHNWYADVLELDCLAVDRDAHVNQWAIQLSRGEYRPSDMRMVPAPKSLPWSFDSERGDGWGLDPVAAGSQMLQTDFQNTQGRWVSPASVAAV
jgi:hypothetical protein